MGYDLRKSHKHPDVLTPEEIDVQQALKEYWCKPVEMFPDLPADQVTDAHDFVPVRVLYGVYRRYVAGRRTFADDPDTLTLRQFGAALPRVFTFLDDYDPEMKERNHTRKNPYFVQRRYEGQRMWGYSHVRGPLSIRRPLKAGRPSHRRGGNIDDYH